MDPKNECIGDHETREAIDEHLRNSIDIETCPSALAFVNSSCMSREEWTISHWHKLRQISGMFGEYHSRLSCELTFSLFSRALLSVNLRDRFLLISSLQLIIINSHKSHRLSFSLLLRLQDGVGEKKQCPDGLRFNEKASLFTYPCQYPIDVDCYGRSELQVNTKILSLTR